MTGTSERPLTARGSDGAPRVPVGLGEIALAAAEAGRDAIAEVLSAGELLTGSKSGAHDLVTTADRAAEAAVLEVLTRLRPDDTVLGEETGEHPGRSGVRWLVDPLDGTVNFVYGRAGWAVSVGAEVDGDVVAGAVVCPADGRWASADADGIRYGGFSTWDDGSGDGSADDRVLTPRPPRAVGPDEALLGDALVSLGQPYGLERRAELMGIAARLSGCTRGLRLTGAAASELLGLAGGDCDAFLSFGLGPWDTAAGVALVRACGGAVREAVTAEGMPVVVATRSARLADELAALVALPAGRAGNRPAQ